MMKYEVEKQIISMQFSRENCAFGQLQTQTHTHLVQIKATATTGEEKKVHGNDLLSIRVKCIKFHAHAVFGINLNLHLKVTHKYIEER